MEKNHQALDHAIRTQWEQNPEIKMDLKTYIRTLGEHLLSEPEYDKDALNEVLDTVSTDIRDIRQNFTGETPSGLEPVRDFMVESLDLYMQSLDDMRKYVDSEDRDSLNDAIVRAEEAEDIMGAIEQVIQEHRDWLAEMTEA
ncbi:MAG: hypothetical protein RDV48_06225 [Candidatus Eremiobacteraeota bacterium]|nr:hypothetical protein [Candidatus Eremiobacteraeota bacterium]